MEFYKDRMLTKLPQIYEEYSPQNNQSVTATIAGITAEFIPVGPWEEETRDFLTHYFTNFPSHPNSKPDFVIYYYAEEGYHGDPLSMLWNEKREEIGIKELPSEYLINQRDFIGRVNKSFTLLYGQGPRMTPGTTDPVDNMLLSMMGRNLIKNKRVPLHAATVLVDDRAYCFYGTSGAGKSTLAMQSVNLKSYAILGADQIYLYREKGRLMAAPTATTMMEFPKNHPALRFESFPVKSLIHLTPRERVYSFTSWNPDSALKYFLKEVIYWQRMGQGDELLELTLDILGDPDILLGEMTYKKGECFWSQLLEDLKKG